MSLTQALYQIRGWQMFSVGSFLILVTGFSTEHNVLIVMKFNLAVCCHYRVRGGRAHFMLGTSCPMTLLNFLVRSEGSFFRDSLDFPE